MAPALNPDSIGPVDVALFVFEGNEFNGDVAPALVELQQNGTVRIIDLSFVHKDADGTTSYLEVEDAAVADAFAAITGDQLDLLSDTDLEYFASELSPDSSALVVVWENTWAARFAAAVRNSGGETVVLERIPREVVVTALEALANEELESTDLEVGADA